MQFEINKESMESIYSKDDSSRFNKLNSEIFKVNSISNNDNSFQLTYNIFQGQLLNGAKKIDKLNFISNIGGPSDGTFISNVNVPYSSIYFLEVKYMCYEANLKFKVSINDIKTDLIYSPTLLSEISVFTLPIALTSGENTIKFHGDGINFAPYLGEFTLKLPPIVNNFEKGILDGNAYVEPNMNFVSAIGGPNDGAVTVAVKVTIKGMYSLKFQYVAADKIRPLKIDVNDINNGEEYFLPLTNGWTINDVKIFTILISLNEGINTLRFHGDGINYGPTLGAFMISFAGGISTSAFATVTNNYNILGGIVGGGAVIDKKLNMVTNIGGTTDGFVTMTVPIDTYGKYLMKINYTNNNRPLKIDINEIDNGIVYMVNGNKSDIFSVTIPLVFGINTLKFHGDSKNPSPDLGNLTLTLIENNFNSDFNGYLLKGAITLPAGIITGLGGKIDGQYVMDYVAEQSGKYILYITADTSKGTTLLIDINGENSNVPYNIPKSNKVIVYPILISLKKGSNTIAFHGDYINNAPNILKIEINLAYAIKESIYKLSDGILDSGANLDEDSNFIEGIGGIDNGNATIKVNVDADGMYDLNINYIEDQVDSPFKFDINNTTMEGILLASDLEDAPSFQTFNITVPLKKGSNSIKFYGNEIDNVPKLGDITVKQSIAKELLTSQKIYQWEKATMSESQSQESKKVFKAIWSNEECAILGNGAFFLTSSGVYIANIGGPNRGGVIIDVNIPKSDDYILTLNYLTTDLNKKLLIDFNYANNPQIINFEKTNSLGKKDVKTIQVKTSLALGKNTIILSGDGVNFAPMIGDFTIIQANKNTEAYKIVSQELKRGAKAIQNGKFITALGGRNKGYILLNINVTLKGQYDLGFKYTSPQEKRGLKIKLNKKLDNIYILPKTNTLTSAIGNSFTIPLNLIAGTNTIEIKGNGNILTPNIGQFTLAVSSINSIIIYDAASGILKNGVRVNSYGLATNIGGPKQGEVSVKITVPFKGIYNLDIEYEPFMNEHFLEVLINDISLLKHDIVSENIIDSTLDLPRLNLKIKLDAGNSIIKLKGKKDVYGPNLGELKIRVDIPYSKNLPEGYFDIANGVLQNGAGIDYDTGLVVNLGGKFNGSVTSTVDSVGEGDYSMILQYRAKNTPSPILIDINGEEDGNIYILDETGDKINSTTVTINLKSGKNTIKFYGDKNDDAPDLNAFLLIPLFQ